VFEPLLHAFVAILNVLVGLIGRTCAICALPKLLLELSTTADTNAIGLPIQ